jgi:hypothetical protein
MAIVKPISTRQFESFHNLFAHWQGEWGFPIRYPSNGSSLQGSDKRLDIIQILLTNSASEMKRLAHVGLDGVLLVSDVRKVQHGRSSENICLLLSW